MARPKFSESDNTNLTSMPPKNDTLLSSAPAPVPQAAVSEGLTPANPVPDMPITASNILTPVGACSTATAPQPAGEASPVASAPVDVSAPVSTSAAPANNQNTATVPAPNANTLPAQSPVDSCNGSVIPPVTPAPAVNPVTPPPEPSIDLPVTEKPKAQAAPVISNIYMIADAKNMATECKFKMDSSKFVQFLKTISLGKLIKDAYIYIREDNKLFCAAAEPSSQFVICFNEMDGVITTTPGRMLITDIAKLRNVVETLKGETEFSYNAGKLTAKGTGTRAKKVELVGLQESYIHSLKGLVGKEINLQQHKIGKLDFSNFTHFFVDSNIFKEMIEAADAINLPSFRFMVDKTTPDIIEIVISNQQDKYTLSITPENFSYGSISVHDKKTNQINPADSYSVCFSPAVREITSLLSGKVEIYLSPSCMILMQAGCCYLVIPCNL